MAKAGSKLYWYGSGGEILAETDAAGNTQNEYIFFGGKRVAVVPASGSPLYYAEDMLGSSRVIVQSDGTLCYDADFTPFGAERAYTSTCPQNYKFEGKERDGETQNDDFGARYYSWRVGRWLSSDWSAVPVAVPYANLTNPQTLNLYSMVADDPESFEDLDGHDEAGHEGAMLQAGKDSSGGNPTVDKDKKANEKAQNKDEPKPKPKPEPKPKPKPKAPKNSRTDVVLYGAGSGKPHHYNAVEWEMTWKAGTCSGGSCSQSSTNETQTITGVEIDGTKPLGPIGDPAQGEANDYLSLEPRTITQWWSVDGQQVQVVLPSGQSSWGVQIEVHGGLSDPPTYSPSSLNEPPH